MHRERRHTRSAGPPTGAEDGLSMIEVLIATVVLALTGLIAFPTLLSFFDLSEHAREENIATHDLRAAAEDVLATPFALVPNTYVDGEPIPKFSGLHLSDQEISVFYADPQEDPLDVRLVATWRDSKGRDRTETLQILRTQ